MSARRGSGRTTGVALVLVAAVGLGASACGADNREMKPPTAQQRAATTTTTPPVSPSDAAGTATQELMQLQSPAFADGAAIPEQYTCTGGGISPPLTWANLPAGVTELALVVRDPDASGFVHWVVSGMSPASGGIGEAQTPSGAVQALNQTGSVGWFGPCPPSGTHTYEFKLYALSAPPGVTPAQDAGAAAVLIESAPALASARVTGTATAPSA
jgi:Raf kinase inhibitor-like YbhB/YbcL family protein